MSDLLDKAIMVGLGLEKKAKEALEELQKSGESEAKESSGAAEKGKEAAEPLTPRQVVENKVVEEGVGLLKEFISALDKVRERLGGELATSSEKVLERLHVATEDELDVIKEMARVAREKTEELEKRVAALEKAAEK